MTPKTYITITYSTGRYERSVSFIRPRSAGKPTWTGAARMVAAHLNNEDGAEPIRPRDVSIHRIESCVLAD